MKDYSKTAYFRFYEELNDFLPPEKRKMKFLHKFGLRESVKDMIESLGVPHSEVDLILVNGRSKGFEYIVTDNDDISVYPVFESFDITNVQHLRPKPLREPKFITDVHLGSLAKYMRMSGLDTVYRNDLTEEEILKISLKEKRAIITKSRNILKRNEVTHGYFVRSEAVENQLEEIINRFHLEKLIKPFTRCMECNVILEKADKNLIFDKIPEKVRDFHNDFYVCSSCSRIYWKGSHYTHMKELFERMGIIKNNTGL